MGGILEIDPATVNADLIYLGLVLSMWFAVTAAYVPGTGVVESVALVGFAATVVVLAQLPTNWFAVLVLIVGVSSFIIMPFIKTQYASLALAGLVLQGIGGLLLFQEDHSVSLFVLALSVVIPAAYHQLVLLPMLTNMRERPVDDRDGALVGKEGRVTQTLDPVGTVYVNSEHWTAIVEDEEIVVPIGEKVIVVDKQSLRLIVVPLKSKRSDTDDSPLAEGGNVSNG